MNLESELWRVNLESEPGGVNPGGVNPGGVNPGGVNLEG
jgi:hypothetical protein